MRVVIAIVLLLVAGCDRPAQTDSAGSASALGKSPCETRFFEGDRFTLCPARNGRIEIVTGDASGLPYRSFSSLEAALGKRAARVHFAMNAGMFDEEGRAIGFLVEDGKQLHKINRRSGGGNFGLVPNGVFLIRDDGTAHVVETEQFEAADDIAFASQSGPMLVIDGDLHPAFEPDGQSRNIRNGVGIAPSGAAVFAISEEPVSFGKFARLFKDHVKARNALYFDGSVSSLWDPGNARRDSAAPIGPMVVVFRKR
ncbi:MAG: phosphodiester glycosidase family protein [Sphingomonas sp.]|nr:phosphodiester glycosidase family protein [Sphingomonas sp.]